MAEPESPTTNKRKASPEPSTEDAAGKRIKLRDGDEAAPSNNGTTKEPGEVEHDATPTKEEREDEARRGTSLAREQRTEPAPGSESRRSPEARRPSASGGPPIRRNVSLEEKKRGQRLFGGLVSTLSRTASGSQQQKRLEIERRQQEKAQQRRAEDEKRRAEKLEQLKRTRQIGQVKLDEQAMKTRHSSMLARAHSLQTRSEPKLYYLPWELTREQEDTISDQIRDAEDAIERETRDFRARKERRLRALGVTPPPRSPSPPPRQQQKQQHQQQEDIAVAESKPRPDEATVGQPKPSPHDTNPEPVAPTPPKARPVHHDKDHDENGDEMMQDEEDIVIY